MDRRTLHRRLVLIGAATGFPSGYLTGLISDPVWRTAVLAGVAFTFGIASLAIALTHDRRAEARADAGDTPSDEAGDA